MSVRSPPASPSAARSHTLPLAAVAAVVVAGAIGGLLVGGSLSGGGSSPAPRATPAQSIAHDGVRLQVPSGWARTDVTTAPGFSRPLALRNSDDGLRATVERLPATSATLLPAAFLRTLGSAPGQPEVVRLSGGRQAWRYRFPATDGSMTLMYAAPTTSGVATVACTAPLDSKRPARLHRARRRRHGPGRTAARARGERGVLQPPARRCGRPRRRPDGRRTTARRREASARAGARGDRTCPRAQGRGDHARPADQRRRRRAGRRRRRADRDRERLHGAGERRARPLAEAATPPPAQP